MTRPMTITEKILARASGVSGETMELTFVLDVP